MGILSKLTDEIKNAMRAKDSLRLDALRAIKSGILKNKSKIPNLFEAENSLNLVLDQYDQRKITLF